MATVTTYTLTIDTRDLTGTAIPGLHIAVEMTNAMIRTADGETIVPQPRMVVTDAVGRVSTELIPFADVVYEAVFNTGGGRYSKRFLMPERDTTLAELTALDVVTPEGVSIALSDDLEVHDGELRVKIADGSISRSPDGLSAVGGGGGGGGGTTYSVATPTEDGLMSSGDKTKLDTYPDDGSALDAATLGGQTSTQIQMSTLNQVLAEPSLVNPSPSQILAAVNGVVDAATLGGNGPSHFLDYDHLINTPTIPDAVSYDVATQDDDGLMSSGDKTKLDQIESGAQVNRGAAATRALIGDADGTTHGLLSNDQFDKLDGIEAGAKDDQDANEIIGLIEGQSGLARLNYQTLRNRPGLVTPTADGLMRAADKMKLDEIESRAQVNRTPEEMRDAFDILFGGTGWRTGTATAPTHTLYMAAGPDSTFTAAEFLSGTTAVGTEIVAPTWTEDSYIAFAVPETAGEPTEIRQPPGSVFNQRDVFTRVAGTLDVDGEAHIVLVSDSVWYPVVSGSTWSVQ